MAGFPDRPQQSQRKQHRHEAAGQSEQRQPMQSQKRRVGKEQDRWHFATEQQDEPRNRALANIPNTNRLTEGPKPR